MGRERRVAPGVSVRYDATGKAVGLRIAFSFRGECKEPLKLAPTPPNIRYASRLRGEILNAIGRGTFNYADYFPESPRARRLGFVAGADTVGVELRAWLAIARLEASTRLTYERVTERYLLPWFKDMRLRDLTSAAIRQRVLDVRKKPPKGQEGPGEQVTLKTARNILTPLGSMLELAVGDDKIKFNPMDRLKLERYWPAERITSDFEADPFAWAEMVEIFAACRGGELGEEADYWRFAFGTGMRPSEQIAIAWPRIDLVQLRARVEEARVTGRDRATGAVSSSMKGPKTRAGRRDVDFTAGAWEALRRQQARTRLAGKEVWRDPRSGAPWRGEEALRKRWARILRRAGVRYRNPYQTRHTFASVLLAAGYPPLWVAKQMGHETTEMLERTYGKWIEQGAGDRQALAGFFSHASPTVARAVGFSL